MESLLVILTLSVLAFAVTNLDNLILLVGVVARPGQAFGAVLGGVLAAVGLVLGLCVAGALLADLAPKRWLGMLGLVPIGLGLRELYALWTPPTGESGGDVSAPRLGAMGVAGLMLGNSADSLAALLPLFAETRGLLLPLAALAVLATGAGGCHLARWIASHPRVGPLLRRVGPWFVPFVLIAVGGYVLLDTRTDRFGG